MTKEACVQSNLLVLLEVLSNKHCQNEPPGHRILMNNYTFQGVKNKIKHSQNSRRIIVNN